jgi:tRNA-Thr(GGU) m(6)t(6)A37 methyltransferase TsaA
MPLQSVAAADVTGTVELEPELEPGLRDLAGFSHVHVVSHLHASQPGDLEVVPFLDDEPRGVFATRSPRPNPIGLSVVRLHSIAGTTLHVSGLDLLDGTPVLDVKPYVPLFDSVEAERTGWLSSRASGVRRPAPMPASRRSPGQRSSTRSRRPTRGRAGPGRAGACSVRAGRSSSA